MRQPKQNHKGLTIAYVALGGNVPSSAGRPEKTVQAAKRAIPCESVNLLAESRLFRTPAFPSGSGPDFVNAVIAVETVLSAEALLAHLHDVEASFERTRDARWGARTVDLDLIAYGAAILPDRMRFQVWHDLPLDRQMTQAPETLILPHPRLQDRAFVLIPMADIDPDWRHPVLGQTVQEMLAALPEAEKAPVLPL
ncbi:2-amino-4-hydroxy-6-hydroxymethyldihydropteridine diphosphokinase [Litoreibacter ponti]|uniref:2-amino-4-hydroxy-6-hydroxymethyldihydropteridine pyrophosphokinase n=1 Tax=Litoreibacter ponti TaxID=1510457 RepID=A0A2T6BML7_9RHOB|nr:2-amino-4-hydroxy-6-hydroxymethyldihydropteridine diphosphokinase [Litoreibacter ponti]PTX57306.1 2-amino-4-hydroxy-6-hydroxymethyldihydropteridine diphosphokinase [Litoreibacter ponti]